MKINKIKYNKIWRDKNKEHIKKYNNQYRTKNRKKINERKKINYYKNHNKSIEQNNISLMKHQTELSHLNCCVVELEIYIYAQQGLKHVQNLGS